MTRRDCPETVKGLTTGGAVNEAPNTAFLRGKHFSHNMLMHPVKPFLIIRLGGRALEVKGRAAQTLALLIKAGATGFTSGEASPLGWARRTSAYIKHLRDLGVSIVTQYEKAGDARIGRYILMEPVVVLRGEVPT